MHEQSNFDPFARRNPVNHEKEQDPKPYSVLQKVPVPLCPAKMFAWRAIKWNNAESFGSRRFRVAESQEDESKRLLAELQGKNIAHYSVMLGAFIQTRMEHDKTLVTASLGGLGYLVTTVTFAGVSSLWDIALFGGGFLGFLLTVLYALFIYRRNAELIEHELRGGASIQNKPRPNLKQLDRFILVAFYVALGSAIVVGSKLGWSKYMANDNSPNKTTQTQKLQESVQGVERLRPAKDGYLRSLEGVQDLKPSAISPAPGSQSPAAGTAAPTPTPSTQTQEQSKPKE